MALGPIYVSSGQTSSGLVIGKGSTLYVSSGGTAEYTTVLSLGHVHVSAGGRTISDTISSGGEETLSAHAVANGIVVSQGGVVDGVGVVSGGEINGSAAGVVLVDMTGDATGIISGVTVEGLSTIAGTAYNVIAEQAVVHDFGYLSGAQIVGGSLDIEAVAAGNGVGSATNITATQSASVTVGGLDAPGSLDGLTLQGASLYVTSSHSQADHVLIGSGGSALYASGTEGDGVTLQAGGSAQVDASASVDTVAVSGGTLAVSGFAYGLSATGGVVSVASGGVLSSATIVSAAELVLYSGAAAGDDIAVSAGGTLDLVSAVIDGSLTAPAYVASSVEIAGVTLSGGYLSLEAPIVDQYATLWIASGAAVSGAVVRQGGELEGPGELAGTAGVNLDYGLVSGIALGDANGGHGELVVESGGVASGVVEAGVGDDLDVTSGGVAVGTELTAPSQFVLDQGGAASGTMLTGAGAFAFVFGSASGTVVASGGVQTLENGGSALATLIGSGGTESVTAGGETASATVSGKGAEDVLSGGRADAPLVLSGGTLSIGAGGLASNAAISAGAAVVDNGEVVYSGSAKETVGGVLSGSGEIVQDGPGLLLVSGKATAFTGRAVISGGTIEVVASGGLGHGAVIFAAPAAKVATLELAGKALPPSGGTFGDVLSDFSGAKDRLDLHGAAYVSGATAIASAGVLTVQDGGYTASFTLAGTAGATYQVTEDGAGYAMVTPVAGDKLAHAVAAFAPEASGAGSTGAYGIQSSHFALLAEPIGSTAR